MASSNHFPSKAECPVPHTAWTAWSVHRLRKDEANALGVNRPYDFLGDDTRYNPGTLTMNPSYAEPISGLAPSMGQLEFDFAYAGGMNDTSSAKPLPPFRNAMNLVPTRYDYGATNSAYSNVKDKVQTFCSSNPYGQDCRNWTAAKQNMENQLSYGKVKLMGNELMPMPQAYYRQ